MSRLADVVRQIAPQCSTVYLAGLDAQAQDFEARGVTTPLRQSHFLGQFLGETGGGKVLQESGNYKTAGRVLEIFGVGRHSAAITAAEAEKIVALPMPAKEKAIFERVYGAGNPHKMNELGNRPGDGWNFRGTGPLQSTGRGSATAWAAKLGRAPANDQLWMLDPKVVFLPSLFEWDRGKLNLLADQDDTRRIRRIINGGYNGMADVEAWQDKAWAALRDPAKQPAESWAAASVSSDTARLQQALNILGCAPRLKDDGRYGPATKAAVAWFQQVHGLKADGIAGPVTTAMLNSLIATTRGVVGSLADAA